MSAFQVAIVLTTLGFPALLAPLLVRLRRHRPGRTWRVLAAIVCLIPLSAPMAVLGTGRPGITMIIAILGGIAMLKAIDWLANPRHADDHLRVLLTLTFWPALQIEDVGVRIVGIPERMKVAARRLVAGAVGVVAGLLLTALGQSLDLPARGIWLDSSLKTLEIYALAGGANSLMVGAFALAGYRVTEAFRYPILARSVLDFWSRYNVWIHRWLKRHVFEPIGRRGRRPALGILAVFAFSGLLHEYLIVAAVPELIGRQLAFFGLHGLGALVGTWLGRRYRMVVGHRIPRALAVTATLAFVLATAPVFIRCMDRFIDLHRDVGEGCLSGVRSYVERGTEPVATGTSARTTTGLFEDCHRASNDCHTQKVAICSKRRGFLGRPLGRRPPEFRLSRCPGYGISLPARRTPEGAGIPGTMIPTEWEQEAMSRTKEGVRRSVSQKAMILALGLCLAELGCMSTSDLKPDEPARPWLFGFWERHQQPPPDPANDYYARYMHAAKARTETTAGASGDPTAASTDAEGGASGPPVAGEMLAEGETSSSPRPRPSRRNASSNSGSDPDEDIQITLGMPEPLPSPSHPPDTLLASTRSATAQGMDRDADSSASGQGDASGRVRRAAEPRPESAEAAPAPRRSDPPRRPKAAAQDPRVILARSEARLKTLATYQVKMSRVERVDGRLQPEEEVVLSIRRQPKEVRLEWASGPSQGREVIYSTRVDDHSLFVHMPKSAIPIPTMKMAVDSPLVTRSSRHSITEAGFDIIINNLRKSVDQTDAANTAQGRAAYRGIEKPPGLDRPSHVFRRQSPSGETWTVFIDARTMLPSMVVAKDHSGQLDEKYIYHEVIENPADLASADAFNPDRRWGESGGLFSRFARGGATANSPTSSQSTTR